MIRHLQALCNLRRLLTIFSLLAVTLASCTMSRPAPRPTQPAAMATPPAQLPAAATVPAQPTATPAPLAQLTVTPTPAPGLAEFFSVPANVIGDRPSAVPGQVIVKLREQPALRALEAVPGPDGIIDTGLSVIDRLNQEFRVRAFEPLIEPLAQAVGERVQSFAIRRPDLLGLYLVSFDPQLDSNAVASAFAADPDVVYAEPNYYAYLSDEPLAPVAFTPNDPFFSYQWHMPLIQAPQAWDVSTGQDVLVAVLDTGIAYEDFENYQQAPDLGNTHFVPGYDFINNDAHANDDEGHGTHVAGTVAQSTNNGQGVSGVAFDAILMPVKVLDNQGQGSYDAIAQGIIYATDRGARIINMSLSGRAGSSTLAEAVDYATSKGVLIVAAAGNSGGAVEYPAAYGNVLAVGSVGYSRTRVDYSNFGPQINLVAPGGDTDVDLNGDGQPDGVLQQTFRDDPTSFGFYFYEGTSMAAPHVSGVAALLFARNPTATADQVRQAMESTALDLGPAGRDNEYGYGLVQAADALAAIGGPPQITPTPTATLTPTSTPPGPGPSPTPTFSPTPTLTVTPGPVSGNLIVNGDFETDGGWIFGATRHPAGYSTQEVHAGARAARLGIVDGVDLFSYSSIWQTVTIPVDARRAMLTYWVYPVSTDVFPQDLQMVLVLNEHFRVISYADRTLSDARQWIQRSYDMTPFAGRTVTIYFGVFNRGYTGRPSAMYVDEVSLTFER
jgi:serine protease